MTVILFLLGWWFFGFIGAGIAFADIQGEFPLIAKQCYRQDLGIAIFMGLVFGPVFLVVMFFMSGFCQHGWRLK